MPLPTFTKVRTGNLNIDRIGDASRGVAEWLRANCPILDGVLIEDQALSTGASGNVITHKLGRPYKGYWVVRQSDYTLTTADQSTLVDTTLFINVRASVAATVTLWVF